VLTANWCTVPAHGDLICARVDTSTLDRELNMVDKDKISATASDLAKQAGDLADKVKERLSDAATKARPVATDLATKAGKATAQGVEVAAGGLKKVSQGKGADKIDSVSATIKSKLPTPDTKPVTEPTPESDAE
jgi:hypothetical protein